MAELSQALIEAGALITALAPQGATLEELFFSLTEDGDAAAEADGAAAGRAGGGRRDERDLGHSHPGAGPPGAGQAARHPGPSTAGS